MTPGDGVAGRLAATFIASKLTPLLIVGSIALGAFAVVSLPRASQHIFEDERHTGSPPGQDNRTHL